jgi:cyclopropane fatty-acyl-phospholipid synthase-like methyltransferase
MSPPEGLGRAASMRIGAGAGLCVHAASRRADVTVCSADLAGSSLSRSRRALAKSSCLGGRASVLAQHNGRS